MSEDFFPCEWLPDYEFFRVPLYLLGEHDDTELMSKADIIKRRAEAECMHRIHCMGTVSNVLLYGGSPGNGMADMMLKGL